MKSTRLSNFLLTLAGVLVLPPLVGFAQESERVIEKIPWRTEPVKVLKLKTKNKDVEFGKKFSEEDDWLVGLSATVQNTSNKAIARIELRLGFPPPKGSSPEKPTVVDPMVWGQEPATASPSEELKLILPGESVEIKLLESNLRWMKEDFEKLGHGKTIKHVQIWVRSVTFLDGSEWMGDEILYPNPNNPKEKINPIRQLPDVSKPPQERSRLPSNSPAFRFLNIGFTRAFSPPRLENTNTHLGKVSLPQLPETQPCNAIFVQHYTTPCGPSGQGCSYGGDDFVENPLPSQSWQFNSRRVLAQVKCKNSNEECSPNSILINERLNCNALVAGTCLAAPNWSAYPLLPACSSRAPALAVTHSAAAAANMSRRSVTVRVAHTSRHL